MATEPNCLINGIRRPHVLHEPTRASIPLWALCREVHIKLASKDFPVLPSLVSAGVCFDLQAVSNTLRALVLRIRQHIFRCVCTDLLIFGFRWKAERGLAPHVRVYAQRGPAALLFRLQKLTLRMHLILSICYLRSDEFSRGW